MDRQKTVFIEALCRKGIYLSTLHEMGDVTEGDGEIPSNDDLSNSITDVWRTLLKFVDPVDIKVTVIIEVEKAIRTCIVLGDKYVYFIFRIVAFGD